MIEREDKKNGIEYQEETYVESFEEAVHRVIKTEESKDVFRFLIVDVDGTLFDNELIKYPFISPFIKPRIKDETKEVFYLLSDRYKDCMAIATNRNGEENLLWNSDEVLEEVYRLIELTKYDTPVFEKMEKQLPWIAEKRIEKLVEYIGISISRNNMENCKKIVLESIEDLIIVSPNRKTFLKFVAKRVYRDWGIRVMINNYVIKK